jgi:hypothetical protein
MAITFNRSDYNQLQTYLTNLITKSVKAII